jgi:hypothetical protein
MEALRDTVMLPDSYAVHLMVSSEPERDKLRKTVMRSNQLRKMRALFIISHLKVISDLIDEEWDMHDKDWKEMATGTYIAYCNDYAEICDNATHMFIEALRPHFRNVDADYFLDCVIQMKEERLKKNKSK